MKNGRNDPCPCGSGKKRKRCCIDKVPRTAEAAGSGVPVRQEARVDVLAAEREQADEVGEGAHSAVDLSLGDVRQTPGDLAEAESSLLVHLALYEWLGSKEGVAAAYGNLGMLYKALGDLAPAEAMYKEALKLHESLGRSEGMAADYGNLGRVYQMRGDLRHAAAMYRKSIGLFRQVGASAQARRVQESLTQLMVARATSPMAR
jgi:tetratricopeptide (TPR) repeat protein